MKKITEAFALSRCSELSVIPLTWNVRKIQTHFLFDLRLSKLQDVKAQVVPLFKSVLVTSLVKEEKKGNDNSDEHENIFQNVKSILKIDFSLNDIRLLKVADLAPFTELRCLDASLNCIETFVGIIACPLLTNLCLSYNNIQRLGKSVLEQCKYLHTIDFRSNTIADLSDFPSLPNLRVLNLSFNSLISLDGLHVLPTLQELHVENNKIVDIVGISVCKNLQLVNLSNNCIAKSVDVIEVLKHLQKIIQLDLIGNPLALNEDFLKLLRTYTSVSILDGEFIKSLKEQFTEMVESSPSASDDPLKLKLKQAIREAMKENLHNKQCKHDASLHYLHSKMISLIADIDTYKGNMVTNTEAWCSYIDTLTLEEAQALSVDRIRSLALKTDGSYVLPDGKSILKESPRGKPA